MVDSAGGTLTVAASDSPELAGTKLVIEPGALTAKTEITLELGTTSITGANDKAAGQVASVPQRVEAGTRGNPLAAGLIAFGAGLVAATFLPSTRREEQLARQVQPQVERLGSQIAGAGRELVDDLRPELESAVDTVSSEATHAGRRLAQDAKEAATSTAGAARS